MLHKKVTGFTKLFHSLGSAQVQRWFHVFLQKKEVSTPAFSQYLVALKVLAQAQLLSAAVLHKTAEQATVETFIML